MATIYRGRIWTGDQEQPWAEALVVDGARLSHVGDASGANDAAGAGADVVDLDGALVVPGFTDAHTHLVSFGESLARVPLTDARDLADIQQRLRAARAADPAAERILGRGWLFDALPGEPTAAMLDEAVPDVPVFLDANDYHSNWMNTAALREAGIDRHTVAPVGGRIGRREDGEPSGILFDSAVLEYVWSHLNAVSTDADRDAAVERMLAAYVATGVTSVVDMAFDEVGLAAVQRAADRRGGTLPLRVRAHWYIASTGDSARDLEQVATAARLRTEVRTPWLEVIGVKFVLDGVIDACTAAMQRPYADGSNTDPYWKPDALQAAVAAADAAGLQVAMHAIGDAASVLGLDALEACGAVGAGRDRPHRIEHMESVTPETIERLAGLGITASMQPVHADPAVVVNWAKMLGDERADRGFPWRSFEEAGALLAFSTDAPTAPHFSLSNLYVATTRASALDASFPAWHPEHAVSLENAVAHATRDTAISVGEGDQRGVLRAGLLADFAVIDRDPFAEGPAVLLQARVVRTVLDGQVVFEVADA